MGNFIGKCKFCGKQYISPKDSQGLANLTATKNCECAEGMQWRAEEERKVRRADMLENVSSYLAALRKEISEDYNVEIPRETAQEIFLRAGDVFDGTYESITMIRGILKFKISLTPKGLIAINTTLNIKTKKEI